MKEGTCLSRARTLIHNAGERTVKGMVKAHPHVRVGVTMTVSQSCRNRFAVAFGHLAPIQ